jgi:N4-gp56 family major capsid protein
MPQTVIPWGDPKAQKKWSPLLSTQVHRKGYFSKRFIGRGENYVIEQKDDLTSDAGDRVSFDLSVKLKQRPTSGDARVKGKEENLKFFTDEVVIDQQRHPVSAGGRMTRKRTSHDLRKIAKDRLAEYWQQYMDEMFFIYLSGARGINEEFIEPAGYTGHATNAIQAPDATHLLYAGAVTAKDNMVNTANMGTELIERAATHAKMIRAKDQDATDMMPVDVDGAKHYVVVMSPYQAYTLRTTTTANNWLDFQKAAAAAEGRKNPIFMGSLGMINNVVLHDHENVIRFNDYGVGLDLPAARALFMGRQAGVVAYGTPGGMRFMWKEEMEDYDNEPTVVAGLIWGVKKTRFNDRDFGVIALDTHAKAV